MQHRVIIQNSIESNISRLRIDKVLLPIIIFIISALVKMLYIIRNPNFEHYITFNDLTKLTLQYNSGAIFIISPQNIKIIIHIRVKSHLELSFLALPTDTCMITGSPVDVCSLSLDSLSVFLFEVSESRKWDNLEGRFSPAAENLEGRPSPAHANI